MKTLDKEQSKRRHKKLSDATGGLELYPSTANKTARIASGLICNPPFVDGNKRIGTYVMLVLLELNKIQIDFSDEAVIRIGLDLVNGRMTEVIPLSLNPCRDLKECSCAIEKYGQSHIKATSYSLYRIYS